MKNQIGKVLTAGTMSLFLLAGCGKTAPAEGLGLTVSVPRESAAQEVTTQPTASQSAGETLLHESREERQLTEGVALFADVYRPENGNLSAYGAQLCEIDPEVAAKQLLPQELGLYSRTSNPNGGEILTTTQGTEIQVYGGGLSLDRYWKDADGRIQMHPIQNLLTQYQNLHPEERFRESAYLSKEDGQKLGRELLEGLGISMTPVLDTCLSFTYDELAAFQGQLGNGNMPRLEGTSGQDDACLMEFSFTWQGIPLYGAGKDTAAVPDMSSNLPLPVKSKASLIVTPNGILTFHLSGAYQVIQGEQAQKIISAEEAIVCFQKEFEGAGGLRIVKVFPEYVPVDRDGDMVLSPYWCVVFENQLTNAETGENWWRRDMAGKHYNAYTGMSLTQGG